MTPNIDFDRPLDCDVAICGAELAGLIAGAILARRGLDVVVIDKPPQVGGGGGSTQHRGYWLDNGHRDGLDVTDLQVGWGYGQLAAQEAQADVALKTVDGQLRVHLIPQLPANGPAECVVTDWSPRGFGKLATDVLGVPELLMPEFWKVLSLFSGASQEERRAAIETPLDRWLAEHVDAPEIRRAVLIMAKTVFCEYPERASAGRLMTFFGASGSGQKTAAGFADDAECGGMQGLSAAFARVIEECGGRILLDLEPVEVLFEGARAVGVVALNASQLVLEVRARHTVIAYPIWDALRLLPEERVDPALVETSRQLADESGDGLSLQIGLKRLPRLRETGETEQHAGWNRFFLGQERAYLGGFHIPSLSSRRVAPAGKHLLNCMIVRWLRSDERPGWRETRETLDSVRHYLSAFYSDFDDCVEWQAYQWVQRPAAMAWFWAPVHRHAVRALGCDALYFANSTVEADTGPVDICAFAGLEAAHAILAETSGASGSS